MRIAHLIVAHTDPTHIKRLAQRLSSFSDVYIHIDKKVGLNEFITSTQGIDNCYFTKKRFRVYWGGMSVVKAELELLQEAREKQHYDRYVLLHGADYPLKKDVEIIDYFSNHIDTEFIRCCCISDSINPYFSDKCRRIWFMDCPFPLLKSALNRIPFRIRSGYLPYKSNKYSVFFGSALWGLTDPCVEYVLDYSKNFSVKLWFKYSYAPDELFFQTIIMNSPFASNTISGGQEPRKEGLVNWRNLHYFEYPGYIRVWRKEDYDYLACKDALYIRKVNTLQSTGLLDILDNLNSEKQL